MAPLGCIPVGRQGRLGGGGGSGMGAATAELLQDAGAEVVVMDFADVTLPGAKAVHVNLADAASIDAAVDECGGQGGALFSCAGGAGGTPGIQENNFIRPPPPIDPPLGQRTPPP